MRNTSELLALAMIISDDPEALGKFLDGLNHDERETLIGHIQDILDKVVETWNRLAAAFALCGYETREILQEIEQGEG